MADQLCKKCGGAVTADGCKLCIMFAAGKAPFGMTDSVFLEGMDCNGSQFEKNPHVGDFLAAEAKATGVSTKGKVYIGGVARYPGDPEAWVSGRGDVQRVAEKRNLTVKGAVKRSADGRVGKPAADGTATERK